MLVHQSEREEETLALENRAELSNALAAGALGAVFARHAYGMRRWTEVLAELLARGGDARSWALLDDLAADNARHAELFRERALAHGVDPAAYRCPAEPIYERMRELDPGAELLGYALGSLDHFGELLSVYAESAAGDDLAAIEEVRADVEHAARRLRAALGPDGAARSAEAHERYRLRELVETPLYLNAA